MKQRSIAGFTLVEILVVISIISMLASVVLASVNTVQAAGRDGKRNEDLVEFRNALELYAASHNGQYPATPQNIALTSMGPVSVATGATPACPSSGSGWNIPDDSNGDGQAFMYALQPYYSQLPLDPTNNSSHCYIYRSSTPIGSNAADAVTYESSYETGTVAGTPVGVVSGGDNTTYQTDVGVPALAYIVGVTPPPSNSLPTASFSIIPTLTPVDTSVTATWSSTNATGCTSNMGAPTHLPPNGGGSLYITATKTFTLSCSGPGGTSNIVNITVTATP